MKHKLINSDIMMIERKLWSCIRIQNLHYERTTLIIHTKGLKKLKDNDV